MNESIQVAISLTPRRMLQRVYTETVNILAFRDRLRTLRNKNIYKIET